MAGTKADLKQQRMGTVTELLKEVGDVVGVAPSGGPPVVAHEERRVRRESLVKRLDLAVEKKLVLITTPAGYGKTALMAQWARANRSRRVAWVTANSAEDAHLFAERLCTGLERADHTQHRHLLEFLPSTHSRMGPAFLSALLHDLQADGSPTVIVLDKFDAIENSALAAEIGTLVNDSAPNVHFVIASRVLPDLSYYGLRLSDQVTELFLQDLVFTAEEAKELISAAAKRELTDAEHEFLWRQTEGWVAGLELAASSLRRNSDESGFIDAFASPSKDSFQYFTNHVFKFESAESRQFLLETSVLDWMNASLCEAVTGRSGDGQRALKMFARGDLFVTQSDTKPDCFRYHELFRSFLRYHLRESGVAAEVELFSRAADWHFAHGEVDVAVGYLIAGRLWDRVLESVQRFGYEFHRRDSVKTVLNWMDCLPPSFVDGRVEVSLLRTALHTMDGDHRDSGSRLTPLPWKTEPTPAELMVADVIRTWSVHNNPNADEVITAATNALDSLDHVDASVIPNVLGLTSPEIIRKVSLLNRGVAEMYSARPNQAHESFERVWTSPTGFVEADVAALGQCALLETWEGRMRDARRDARRAVVTAEQSAQLRLSYMNTVSAHLALARADRAADELVEAGDRLDDVFGRLNRRRASAQVAICVTEQALVALAMGEPDKGLSAIGTYRASGTRPLPIGLDQRLVAAEARLLAAEGDFDRAVELLHQCTPLVPESSDVAIRIAVDRFDPMRARELLHTATITQGENPMPLEFQLWECILDDIMGNEESANHDIASIVIQASEENNVRVFLDAGHHALRLLRRTYLVSPKPFLRKIVGNTITSAVPAKPQHKDLFEPLSERECRVLGYLPGRLSNAEIALQLRISVNTLKTHLKHIYRKLNVDTRREAVAKAEELFLL